MSSIRSHGHDLKRLDTTTDTRILFCYYCASSSSSSSSPSYPLFPYLLVELVVDDGGRGHLRVPRLGRRHQVATGHRDRLDQHPGVGGWVAFDLNRVAREAGSSAAGFKI